MGAEHVGDGGTSSSEETLAVVGIAVTLLVTLLLLLPWVRPTPNAINPGHAPPRANTRQWKWWTTGSLGFRAAIWATGAVAAASSQLRESAGPNVAPAPAHAWAAAVGHSVMVLTALTATATVATHWIRRARETSADEHIENMRATNQRQTEANTQTELPRGHSRSTAAPAAGRVTRLAPHARRGVSAMGRSALDHINGWLSGGGAQGRGRGHAVPEQVAPLGRNCAPTSPVFGDEPAPTAKAAVTAAGTNRHSAQNDGTSALVPPPPPPA